MRRLFLWLRKALGIHVEIESKETLSLAVITERLQNRRREVEERHSKKATLGL